MRVLPRVLVNLLSIVLAFFICSLLMIAQKHNPLEVFRSLFDYSLGSWFSFASTLNSSVVLILCGLSAAVAFTSGVVNLGQHGQLLIGAITAAILGVYISLPSFLGIAFLVICGGISGMLWAGIAAFLKRKYSMDEFISTLMLNFIAEYFTIYLATYPFLDKKAYVPATKMIKRIYFMPDINGLSFAFFVALLMVILSYWFIARTKHGYEFRMMGFNREFAKTGGCDIQKNTTTVLLYTGFLAGLAGSLLIVAGTQKRFMKGIGANFGWDGVMIAIISSNSVVETAFYALFFGAIKNGGIGMEFEASVPSEFILFLQSVIVLTVIGARKTFEVLSQKLRSFFELKKAVGKHA